jgi:hypothetical protein
VRVTTEKIAANGTGPVAAQLELPAGFKTVQDLVDRMNSDPNFPQQLAKRIAEVLPPGVPPPDVNSLRAGLRRASPWQVGLL